MFNWKLKILSALTLMTCIWIYSYLPAQAFSRAEVKKTLDKTSAYLINKEKNQKQPLSAWSYIALSGAGRDLGGTRVMHSCEQQFAGLQSGELNNYSVLVLTLLAAGSDPYNYKGENLVEKIQGAQLANGKFADFVDRSGAGSKGHQVMLNAHAWAVLAIYAAGAEVPDSLKAREWLVAQQQAGGGFNWNLTDRTPDVDSTGMALAALAVLGEKNDSPVVHKALAYLKTVQEENGGFISWGAPNPQSCHMVITGLISLGIDPTGEDWSKPRGNPVTAMLSYMLPDGSFEHIKGMGSNEMATEQSLQALANLYHGKTLFQRFRELNPPVANGPPGHKPARQIAFKLGEKKYQVVVDGKSQVYEADAAAFLHNDRTFVPVRYLALALGIPEDGIGWIPFTQTVTLMGNGITVDLAVGRNTINTNGKSSYMDVTPLILPPGRTFLPARYVAEAFGYRVEWSDEAQIVTILR